MSASNETNERRHRFVDGEAEPSPTARPDDELTSTQAAASADAMVSRPAKELLTPVELAERWGVTTGHLANLRHLGEGIGYLKLGSRVAYRVADVMAYEESVYVHAGGPAHAS